MPPCHLGGKGSGEKEAVAEEGEFVDAEGRALEKRRQRVGFGPRRQGPGRALPAARVCAKFKFSRSIPSSSLFFEWSFKQMGVRGPNTFSSRR